MNEGDPPELSADAAAPPGPGLAAGFSGQLKQRQLFSLGVLALLLFLWLGTTVYSLNELRRKHKVAGTRVTYERWRPQRPTFE